MKVYVNGDIVNIAISNEEGLALTIEEAEQLWQELMNFCYEYRRQEQIAKVNN